MAWGKKSPNSHFEPIWINRPKFVIGEFVRIKIHYCGVCHQDVRVSTNQMGNCMYPCVPGHEIVGEVSEIGPSVSSVEVGDRVGIGSIIDACLSCFQCK